MAPKSKASSKRQRGESSQARGQPQGQAFQRFHTPEALERYQSWISKRTTKKERGLEIVVPEEWNWGYRFLAQPGDAFDSIVREFYANAKDGMQANRCIVRGVEVDFSPEAINTYYGTTDYEGHDHYHYELRPGRITQEELGRIARSFHPDARWNIRNGVVAHMDYTFFSSRDRAILDFIKAKLIPNSHRGNVRRDQVLLTYCINQQETIDIGRLIFRSICETAQAEAKSRCYLGHPSLITELCKLAGVPIDEHNEVTVKPQLLITQHHIETRYGQGQVPIPDPEDDEADEDEAMGNPQPIPAQIPPQYDMTQFFARQEEFMRKQEEFMRRGDDVNWFVGTSMYQHNQAAQGFTPTFPPPPPWLQDPQYIPEYYRSQYPPPPPEGDNQ